MWSLIQNLLLSNYTISICFTISTSPLLRCRLFATYSTRLPSCLSSLALLEYPSLFTRSACAQSSRLRPKAILTIRHGLFLTLHRAASRLLLDNRWRGLRLLLLSFNWLHVFVVIIVFQARAILRLHHRLFILFAIIFPFRRIQTHRQ